MAGTHFRNPGMFAGLSNNTKWFKDLPVDNNPNFVCYKDDFIYNTLPSAEWSTSIADAGAAAGISNEVGGAVTLTSANTTDNNGYYRLIGADKNLPLTISAENYTDTTISFKELTSETIYLNKVLVLILFKTLRS